MNYNELAEVLFPNIKFDEQYYENKYPERNLPEGAKVTRLAPSPTGFIHLGNLYGAFVDERLAHQSGGVFFLRIEDTDDKRYVEGAVEAIINSLGYFGIDFDEGATMDGDIGDYGSYTQSQRGEIYRTFAKKMVREGNAYPCFLNEDEIDSVRKKQEIDKVNTGIYGEYATSRDMTLEEVKKNLEAGIPYVIRLRSTGDSKATGDKIKRNSVCDEIRGNLDVPENFQDVVILKANGMPTYHFAHVVDDHFMRTTHVVRGEEWLLSFPIHIELFQKLSWDLPIFCHTAQLMKLGEDGNKRKLSKREDPELSLEYYRKEGYHKEAVREYLLTILNSNFEQWRMENPNSNIDEFNFTTEKMSNSGALFDLNKLNDISKGVLLKISAKEIVGFLKEWVQEFKPELLYVFDDEEYLERIIDIGRSGDKPRKDLISASQIMSVISYFFDELFERVDDYPEEVSPEDINLILMKYLETYNHNDEQSEWFDKIKAISTELGYAEKPKEFKKNPEQFKGHIGHVSTVIRVAIVGRSQSPDVHEISQIMGEQKIRERIESQI